MLEFQSNFFRRNREKIVYPILVKAWNENANYEFSGFCKIQKILTAI